MKKIILLSIIILISIAAKSQSLTNWKHYYTPLNFSYDMGNYFVDYQGGDLFKFNKSTFSVTRIPVPADIRELNLHNTLLYDSNSMSSYSNVPYLLNGPNYTVLLHSPAYNITYLYDGINWSPITNYHGFNIDSISFFPYKGGSVFFQGYHNLYKYDGSTVVAYNSSNSPIGNAQYYGNQISSFDDMFFTSAYNVAVLHNGSWAIYDTTFFNTYHSFLNAANSAVSSTGNFTFLNIIDTTLHSYSRVNDNWTSSSIPAAFMHATTSYVLNTYYDDNDNLWLAGNGIFCRYDGQQFYDYYSNVINSIGYVPYIIKHLFGNSILFNGTGSYYIYNPITSTLDTIIDNQAKLSGNFLLPSLKDSSGNIWIGATGWGQGDGLMKFDGTKWSYPNLHSHQIYDGIYSIVQDTGNSIAFGYGGLTSNGPVQLSDTNLRFVVGNNQDFKGVQDLAIDKQHHYWFGGSGAGAGQGLVESHLGVVNYYTPPNGLFCELYSIAIDTLSNKWVSFNSFDGVYKFLNGNWTHFNHLNSPLPNDTVIDIEIEKNTNAVWFCTVGGFAKYYNNTWSIYNKSNTPLPSNDAEYVYFADDSTTWFATQEGFASLKNNVWNVYTVFNSPLCQSDIESMVIDNNCNIWLCAEGALITASLGCSANSEKRVHGTVVQSNNAPVANALIYVFKENVSATDYAQVDNTYTDAAGHFDYVTKDSGQFYFMVENNQLLFPGQMPVYEDSSLVVQQSASIHLNANGNYPVSFKMKQAVSSAGTLTFSGQLQSTSERVGDVRLLLMLNNQAVASTYSNVDGSFRFQNIAAASYSIWVDKIGLNNQVAPFVPLTSVSSNSRFLFNLYSTYLSLSPLSVNNVDLSSFVSVFPNPFKDQVTVIISKQNVKQVSINIRNIVGHAVYTNAAITNRNKTIELSNLSSGIYLMEIIIDGERVMKKIIKQ